MRSSGSHYNIPFAAILVIATATFCLPIRACGMIGIGEAAALLAALLWTFSSMLWGKINLSAMTLNFAKNIFGLLMVLAHLCVVTWWLGLPTFSAEASSWAWLAVSGVVGIVIGDGFYFRSLQILGPRLALMFATTAPIFSLVIGWLILGELLAFNAIWGVLVTVAGVFMVVHERKTQSNEAPGLMPGTVRVGIWTGILGAVCQALGGVLSRLGMNDPVTGANICDPVEGAFIRILVAAIGTTILIGARGQVRQTLKQVFAWEQLRLVIPATALGTWLGIWLSQVAYRESFAAVAQTLLGTCPLFAIPIVWYSGRYRLTVLSVMGTLIAILGIAVIAISDQPLE